MPGKGEHVTKKGRQQRYTGMPFERQIQRLEDQLSHLLKISGIRMMWVLGEWTWVW